MQISVKIILDIRSLLQFYLKRHVKFCVHIDCNRKIQLIWGVNLSSPHTSNLARLHCGTCVYLVACSYFLRYKIFQIECLPVLELSQEQQSAAVLWKRSEWRCMKRDLIHDNFIWVHASLLLVYVSTDHDRQGRLLTTMHNSWDCFTYRGPCTNDTRKQYAEVYDFS